MKILISPSKIKGSITAPPSKSISHRAIICASLSKGKSVIDNCNICEDTLSTIYSMRELGARIDIIGTKLIITGMDLEAKDSEVRLNANSSASTLRFVLPLATHLYKNVVVKVNKDLIKRPLTVYEKLYGEKKYELRKVKSPKINRIFASGDIDYKEYKVDGSESSQYISGLLFLLPILKHNSKIVIENKISSKSYIDLTIDVLHKFGIKIKFEDNIITIKGNQQYKPKNMTIEGDWTLASNFLALGGALGSVSITGLPQKTLQKDIDILDILKKMCCEVSLTSRKITVNKSNLMSCDLDLNDNVDLAFPVAFLNSFALGGARLSNANRLVLKESDRKKEIVKAMKLFNINASSDKDNIYIAPSIQSIIDKTEIKPVNDHRIIMLLIMLAISSKKKVIIDDVSPLDKSYPNFLADMKKVGAKIKVIE